MTSTEATDLHEHESANADARATEIIAAIDALRHNPQIDRGAAAGYHELVIGRDGHACLRLYHYITDIDIVFVMAIRSLRETGYLQS